MSPPTIQAILGYTGDPQLQAAMALGSRLEGGWGPAYGVGDLGTSFGPYQIHLPAHPGVTEAEASDPVWATHYMGGSYQGGLGAVGQAAWAEPESAAEQVAYHAERPAEDYVTARGQAAVDTAWAATMNTLPSTSAAAVLTAAKNGGGGSGGGGVIGTVGQGLKDVVDPGGIIGKAGGLITGPASKAAGAATDAIGGAIGDAFSAVWSDAKPFVVTMGFAGLGLALIGAGLVISTRGARSSATTNLPAIPDLGGGRGGAATGEEAAAGGGLADLAPLALA